MEAADLQGAEEREVQNRDSRLSYMTKRDVERAVRRIAKFLSTPEGKASLREAMEQAERFNQEQRRKRMVDPLSLFERVTI